MILPREFFLRPVQIVARDMLGKRLIHLVGNQRVGGIIVEAEAYDGEQDLAYTPGQGLSGITRICKDTPMCIYLWHALMLIVTGETAILAVLIRALCHVRV
jgi:DNA-3-methyladenine glycosylase